MPAWTTTSSTRSSPAVPTRRSEVAEPSLLARRRAAAALAERRPVGALEIELQLEPEFEFDADGGVTAAHGVAQTEAHRLIEHLMIPANERVAELLERRKAPTLYRVHEQPDPERVERLLDQPRRASRPCPRGRGSARRRPARWSATPAGWSRRSARRRGHGRTRTPSSVLRSLKQAYYLERNPGPRRAGEPGVLPLHRRFAATRPDRPPLAARDAGSRRIGARPRRGPGRRLALLGAGAGRHAHRAAGGSLARRSSSSVSCSRTAGTPASRARFRARRRRGLRPVRRRAGRRVRGLRAGQNAARERFDLNETETALVGRRTGREVRLGDPMAVTVHSAERRAAARPSSRRTTPIGQPKDN